MRIFVAGTPNDLAQPQPPTGHAFTIIEASLPHGSDLEEAEYQAQTEAALASLERLRDQGPGQGASRVVFAGDASGTLIHTDADTHVSEVHVSAWTWSNVEAILADGPEAAQAVTMVLEADTQDDADQALIELWDFALQWYDISERQRLAAELLDAGGARHTTGAS